jgi:copper transport protein
MSTSNPSGVSGTNACRSGELHTAPGRTLMAMLGAAVRRVTLLGTLAVMLAVVFATPAAAHAELVSISPANGAQLTTPPTEVRMTFTERVNLIDGGIRLIDEDGRTVRARDPSVNGRTVSWPMPAELPDGSYVVTWRVVSADGHPVSGASSFSIRTAVAAEPGSTTGTATDTTGSTVATGSTAPWPVVIIRLAGYAAFALFAGAAAFVLFCAPDSSREPTLQRLVRGGILGGAAATVAATLVQGPYTAGVSMRRVLDTRLVQQTLGTPFGTAMVWRLALYGVLGVLAWRLPRILNQLGSWLVPAGIAGVAATIAAAGHAAALGPLDLAVDAVHALTAGLWVGGLVVLVALGRSIDPRALHKFSTLALASVLTVIATGTINALYHLNAVEQLWQTQYGVTLLVKLTLVAGTLAAAAVSRRRLQQNRRPLRSVRLEVALTVAILAVTALLTLTAPPPQIAKQNGPTGNAAEPPTANDSVQLSLGNQRKASLTIVPATTTASHLHLVFADGHKRPLPATRVTLKVANPGRDIAPIAIPMSMRDGAWVGNYRFPFPGIWKIILTVDGIGPSAIVTTAEITIRG